MASEGSWEPETLFNLYMHDYMVKKKMKRTASIFKHEAKLPDHSVAIDDSQKGMLRDWWTLFWDVFAKSHFGGNDMDRPKDSLQQMQSHNSATQPHLETEGRISGSSFGTPSLNIPNTSSSVRIPSSPLPPQVVEGCRITSWGRLIPPLSRSRDNDELSSLLNPEPLNGWPVNAPNSLQQVIFPRVAPSTHGSQTSSPRNSAAYSSNLNRINNGSSVADDQMVILE